MTRAVLEEERKLERAQVDYNIISMEWNLMHETNYVYNTNNIMTYTTQDSLHHLN